MMSRSASRWFVAALFACSAAVPVVGAGAAHAATAAPAHWNPGGGHDGYGYGYGGYHRHHHPNCNNDPDSPYAMSPECPYSHNSDYSRYGDDGYGWPDD